MEPHVQGAEELSLYLLYLPLIYLPLEIKYAFNLRKQSAVSNPSIRVCDNCAL